MKRLALILVTACGSHDSMPMMPDAPPVPMPMLDVEPATYVVPTGRSQIFVAPTATSWTVMEGDAGGTVEANGAYTAPLVPGTYHVVASNGTEQGIATITVADFELGILAGQIGGTGYAAGVGRDARVSYPNFVIADSTGAIYFGDATATIRKVDPVTHAVTVVAGVPNKFGIVDGIGSAARIDLAYGLALDETHGVLYFSESHRDVIRKVVLATGAVTTIAGQVDIPGAHDAIGTAATFATPSGLAFDGNNTLFVADETNCLIRAIALDSATVSTFAGVANTCLEQDSPPRFSYPTGILYTATAILVADRSAVRAITAFGVSTIAGTATIGYVDQPGAAARFGLLGQLVTDGAGTLYVSDLENHAIRTIALASPHTVTTLAGGTAGVNDGMGASAQLGAPTGLTFANGTLWTCDTSTLRTVSTGGTVTTIIGEPAHYGTANGPFATSLFEYPDAMTSDGAGNLYVSEDYDVRLLAAGATSLIAGSSYGAKDGTGMVALFAEPDGVIVDPTGTTLYVADPENNSIRQIGLPSGAVTTPFDSITTPQSLTVNATGTASRFLEPCALVIVGTSLYVADSQAHVIRAVDLVSTQATTFAGTGAIGHDDGPIASATFGDPAAIASDGTSLYVSDVGNRTIREIDLATAMVSTIAGATGLGGISDGIGTEATFETIAAMTYDGHGTLYLSDSDAELVRRIYLPTGAVSTLLGVPYLDGVRLGSVTTAQPGKVSGFEVIDPRTFAVLSYNENAVLSLVQQ